MAFRFDRAPIGKAVRSDNGWLRAPAILSRTGVFSYRNADGSTRRELRLPEEVFKADAMQSFELVPLTDDHPQSGVDGKNATSLARGSVGKIQQDGDDLVGELLVTDAETVDRILAGKTQLSCGYECDLEMKEGTHNGERYDAIQRNIRGNHVALVARGRAGNARVRLDSASAEMVEPSTEPQTESNKMLKIRIDGVECEVAPTVADLIAKERATSAALLDAVKAESAKLKADSEKNAARADTAEAKAKQLEGDLAKATDAKAIAAQVQARVALEKRASEVLGAEIKLDAMTDLEVKKAVIVKLDSAADLTDKSVDYVAARFDFELASKARKNPAAEELAKKLEKKDSLDGKTAQEKFNAAVFAPRF